ncbi:MAG: nucleotidyltransferase family protein [Candidatus Coproplasma sp.]
MNLLIKIIRSVLNGEKLSVKIDEGLFALAKYHSVATYLYPCMDTAVTDKAVADQVTQIYFTALKRDLIQQTERAAIEEEFEKKQVRHVELKGMVMKGYYPQPHLRTMGDMDYLIAEESFSKARQVLTNAGYTVYGNCEHHLELSKPPIMLIELHRMLIAQDDLGRELFENIIERCKVKQGKEYALEMSDEDFYLHLMLHLIKHYVYGGTGLRSFIDVYLYLKAKPDLDREYLSKAFEQTKYADTVALVERFAIDLFDGNPLDSEEQKMLERVIYSGTYGTMENTSEKELDESGNSAFKIIMRKLFPTVRTMKGWYPILGKGAGILLLPVFYIWHPISRVFKVNSYRRAKQLIKSQKQSEEEENN